MMKGVIRIDGGNACPLEGNVVYDAPKIVWNLGMIICALVFAPFAFNLDAFLLFVVLTWSFLLAGHSVGMHRLMIHGTFDCHPLVAKTLIYIGVLVGMSGPFGIIKIHDLRDWAQRQAVCHDFFAHTRGYWRDLWWQLTCRFQFKHAPQLRIEDKYFADGFYRWLEKTWRFHQLFFAIALYLIGGWAFVVWGVFVRVSVSIVGHWTITYFCHNPGPGQWRVKGASVQASNIPGLGIVTYGECWHNNHHAFPESARIGLYKGQTDPGWWFIKLLENLKLANNIGYPRETDKREDLSRIETSS